MNVKSINTMHITLLNRLKIHINRGEIGTLNTDVHSGHFRTR